MRDRYLKYLLILPAFSLVAVTIIYPLGYAGFISFMDWRLSRSRTPTDFVGLENYLRAFFDDSSFINALSVTFTFVIGSALGAVIVALLIALLLARQGRGYTIARTVLALPFAMSPALQGTSFRFFLNPEFGIFDRTLKTIFPFLQGIDWLGQSGWAMAWLILTDMWHWSPFLSLMLIGGLLALPRETHEAAMVDGASSWTIFLDRDLAAAHAGARYRLRPEDDLFVQDVRICLSADRRRSGRGHQHLDLLRLSHGLPCL